MNDSGKACFICGDNVFIDSSNHYLRCIRCGHEIIKKKGRQAFIVNDLLCEKNIEKSDLLDKFKRKLLMRCTVTNELLLDVGSASGKFIYQNRDYFKNCIGVEVTEACIDFAKNRLGLNIIKNINDIESTGNISVVTFWHSLEHMPDKDIECILDHIRNSASFDTRIIVSVPNNCSLQYVLFKEAYAYYDPQGHVRQFSVKSLNTLMAGYGFETHRSFYSFPYTVFGYLQGFINKFNTIHNYLYYRKKRGETFGRNRTRLLLYDMYNYMLALFFIMPSLLWSLCDFIKPDRGGVITVCYRKKRN